MVKKIKLTKEDYVARISTATPLQLVIINYELLLQNIHEAKEHCEILDLEKFDSYLRKAQEFLMTLMSSLNMNIEISHNLMSLYVYCNKLIIKSRFEKNYISACEACDILGSLLDSWREIAKTDVDVPVMGNSQKLIAGLTYKDGELTEFVIEDNNRGFKA